MSYEPRPLPYGDPDDLPRALEDEHRSIAGAFAGTYNLPVTQAAEVAKPVDGMLRYFDSTVFTPSGGATGLYLYSGGAWNRLNMTPV